MGVTLTPILRKVAEIDMQMKQARAGEAEIMNVCGRAILKINEEEGPKFRMPLKKCIHSLEVWKMCRHPRAIHWPQMKKDTPKK